MANNLVIVESPSKAKTIKKYLGSGYSVVASMGHIIDLPKSKLGIDVENGFTPQYITIRGKSPLLKELKTKAKSAKTVYLATDPDREGEAISWHLARVLDLDGKKVCRVAFNEITKNAVKAAISNPRTIDEDLVNAQQARRVLDRIVGYRISPLLWKKVKKGLSAGRVQSVATRLVVDREEEINAFIPEEYWTIEAKLKDKDSKKTFTAKFYGKNGKKIELKDEKSANAVLDAIKDAEFKIESIKLGEKKVHPSAPFITSTLQQEASRKLNFTSSRTMSVAQQLYEGVDIQKQGTVGLITYMRTDSLRISNEALAEVRSYIGSSYGDKYLPKNPNYFKTSKNAQDAHEAIRPTTMSLMPDVIKDSLTSDQYKLYKLIWNRFVASQMADALYDTVLATIDANSYTFRASGSTLRFDGFTALYTEGKDADEEKEGSLPKLTEGQVLENKGIDAKQHFTQPPARYTEATLIKALEELGIGRPSTYAPTVTTIMARGYVSRDKKNLLPTELGKVTTDIMKQYFTDIVDVKFTAGMESELDEIETGKKEWVSVISEFYGPFDDTLKKAESSLEKITIKDEESDVKCDKCGRMMVYKIGKFGKFLACPGFPECRNTKAITQDSGVLCPLCSKKVLVRKSKKGRLYYGCEDNPKCEFMTWNEPVKNTACPKCGKALFKSTNTKAKTVVTECLNPDCDYRIEEVKTKKGNK